MPVKLNTREVLTKMKVKISKKEKNLFLGLGLASVLTISGVIVVNAYACISIR
jgi:cell division protein FtsL